MCFLLRTCGIGVRIYIYTYTPVLFWYVYIYMHVCIWGLPSPGSEEQWEDWQPDEKEDRGEGGGVWSGSWGVGRVVLSL